MKTGKGASRSWVRIPLPPPACRGVPGRGSRSGRIRADGARTPLSGPGPRRVRRRDRRGDSRDGQGAGTARRPQARLADAATVSMLRRRRQRLDRKLGMTQTRSPRPALRDPAPRRPRPPRPPAPDSGGGIGQRRSPLSRTIAQQTPAAPRRTRHPAGRRMSAGRATVATRVPCVLRQRGYPPSLGKLTLCTRVRDGQAVPAKKERDPMRRKLLLGVLALAVWPSGVLRSPSTAHQGQPQVVRDPGVQAPAQT